MMRRIAPFIHKRISKWDLEAVKLQNNGSVRGAASSAKKSVSDFEQQHKTSPTPTNLQKIPIALYGGRHTVSMLPGAGIGPELMSYVKEVFRVVGAPVDFEMVYIDPNKDDESELQYAITSIKRNGVAIKGNIETNSLSKEIASRNVALRNELHLYANVLHFRTYAGVPCIRDNMDIIVIRQNVEGEYAMLEHEVIQGLVESLKIITVENSERVARFAFEYARRHGRKKVTTVHKANIMKSGDGLFLEVTRRIAQEFPEIEHNDMIIDNCCMQLVSNPYQFDVMVTPNLYGNIVSNVVCGLVGGAGLFSGKNYGNHYAVFETGTRNTGTAIAGKNIANPIAMLNASVDMLEHLGHTKHADIIAGAIEQTICTDRVYTPDLGGTASSTDVVQRVIDHIVKSDIRVW